MDEEYEFHMGNRDLNDTTIEIVDIITDDRDD